jgi:flagellar biosynthesis protein FliP
MRARFLVIGVVVMALFTAVAAQASAQQVPLPEINLKIGTADTPQQVSVSLQILLLLTVLSLAPAIIIMLTSFTRIMIVFAFTRQALATQQIPPNQVLVGLAVFLTIFIMAPVGTQMNDQALQPFLKGEITQMEAATKAMVPLRDFMLRQTRENDLALFVEIAKMPRPAGPNDIPTHVLIPAFIISELKTAFQMGFVIFIPFLIIDMVVGAALMSMGMMLLPPVVISFPFKILLFVMVDGWHLITRSLVYSFH